MADERVSHPPSVISEYGKLFKCYASNFFAQAPLNLKLFWIVIARPSLA